MSESFRSFPRCSYGEWSYRWALELSRFARAYGELHPESFEGVDCIALDQYRETAVARFTGGLDRHREALDPRIVVEQGVWSLVERATLEEAIARFVNDWGDARLHRCSASERGGFVSVGIETEAFDDLERALADRFGDAVDVERLEYRERKRAFQTWTVDETSRVLTVQFMGGSGERGCRLELLESDGRVEATVVTGLYVTTVPSKRSNAPRRGRDRRGHSREASARLARPLGSRAVVDASTGETVPQRQRLATR